MRSAREFATSFFRKRLRKIEVKPCYQSGAVHAYASSANNEGKLPFTPMAQPVGPPTVLGTDATKEIPSNAGNLALSDASASGVTIFIGPLAESVAADVAAASSPHSGASFANSPARADRSLQGQETPPCRTQGRDDIEEILSDDDCQAHKYTRMDADDVFPEDSLREAEDIIRLESTPSFNLLASPHSPTPATVSDAIQFFEPPGSSRKKGDAMKGVRKGTASTSPVQCP